MGLSSFPSASEGLLPLVAANAALSISATKSFLRCVRQLMGSPERALRGEERDCFSMSRFESSCSGHSGGTGECCAVCLCGFEAEEEVGELRCGHVFHIGCLMKWFDSRRHQRQQLRRTCPLCRSVL